MNSHSELPGRKRCRDEENPNALSSPEQSSNNKKKKKKKGNWTKKKNKGALIPQDPPPSTTEPNVRHIQLRLKPNERLAEPNEQHQVCPNPNPVTRKVATAIPIAAEKGRGAEPNGANAEHPVSDSTPRKRKNKNKKDVIVIYYQDEPHNALQVESEQKNSKEKGAEPSEASAVEAQVCHKHEVATVVETAIPVVQEKKNCVELKETSVEQPQVCSKLELAPMVVVDPGKEKGVGANGVAAENPQVCSKHDVVTKVVEPGKENDGVGKIEGAAEHPRLVPVPDSTPSKDTPPKKKWENEKKNVLVGQGVDLKGPNAGQLQLCDPVDPAISIGIEPKIVKEIWGRPDDANAERPLVCHERAIPIVHEKKEGVESSEGGPKHEQVIPVDAEKKEGAGPNQASADHPKLHLPVSDPTPRKDTRKRKKRERKKKNVVNKQGSEPKGPNAEHPQPCNPVDPAIPIGAEPNIMKEIGAGSDDANVEQPLVFPKHESAIAMVPEKKEGVESNESGRNPANAEKEKGAGPNEASEEHPKLLLPVSDPTPPKDSPQKRKWERKKKNVLNPQGAEPKESNNAEHAQVFSKPKSAPPVDPQHVIPMGPRIPTNPEQKLSKRKRKKKKRKSALKDVVAEPDKHNGKPPEIPVQRSICPIAASQTDQTMSTDQKLSIDPATPIGPEQKMAKKKKRKKSKSALKSKGSESDKRNTESTAEISVV